MTARKKRGFALILSLSLMGLMVLLALTLSALIQIESGAADNQRNLALARQNALAGAYQAIGVLQQQLGPDQRVTARADLDSANIQNPYWVGVWSTETVSSASAAAFNSSRSQLGVTPVRWLVSMSTASASTSNLTPSKAISASVLVTLVKSPGDLTGTLAKPVTAARIAISSGDQISGGYAWWVSDEGMKASLRLNNNEKMDESASLNGLSQQERRARRVLSLVRAGVEALSTNGSGALRSDSAVLSTAEQKQLSLMASSGQLAYLTTISFTETRSAALSHDLTALSMGVLSSTLETTQGNTLKVDLSMASTTSQGADLFGVSAQGIMAYLNAYRNATVSNGVPALPLTPTVPDDKGTVVTGKAYFSIAPVISEIYFSSSLFHKGGILGNGSTINAWPVVYTTSKGYMGIDTRTFAYFELWNPYSTAILPQNGHLQLRVKNLPQFRIHYWYDASPIADYTTANSSPVWIENNISGGVSDWLSLQDKLNSSRSTKDYIGVHLLNQASTSATPQLYTSGSVLYWFGIRLETSLTDSTPGNGAPASDKGYEYISGYGAAKEFFKETDRGLTHGYYQSFGAQLSANWATSKDIAKVRMPVFPKEQLPTSSPYRADNYANTITNNFTAMSLEWESTQPIVELWWVTTSTPMSLGDIENAVLLSSVRMPANAASSDKPPNGELRNIKYYTINHNNEHYALHYVRKDASDSPHADGRVSNDWLTSTTSKDPRTPARIDDAFQFFDSDDPNEHFVQSDSGVVKITPDINGTLTQQLDRLSGVLNNQSALNWSDVHNYIAGQSGAPKLTSEGDLYPARKTSLFEVPTTAPISLGVLQNVTLGNRRPFCIGNSWGRDAGVSDSNVNLIFDRAYLSALTVSSLANVDPDLPLPNSNLMPLWTSTNSAPASVDAQDVLSYFLVKGAFNVNSTSVEAWKAFLGGGWIEDWDYVSIPSSPSDNYDRSAKQLVLRRSFLRFSHTGDETFTAPDNTGDMGLINGKYYRRGVRRLTNAQLEAMATIIVEVIKGRKGPYASITEFLSAAVGGVSGNPSLLEYAANPSDTYAKGVYSEKGAELPYLWTSAEMSDDGDSTSGTATGIIDVCSPADLTQGAMLNTLAPLIQARSDTFKIRAYGDVKDTTGQTAATALCEVMVQRMPDPVEDSTTSANRKKPGSKGRVFKVVSIKWIQDS